MPSEFDEKPAATRSGSHRAGFTLVEVIVLLTVLAIVVAIAIPATLRLFEETAEDATRTEMQKLKDAMIGNPNEIKEKVRSDFGFLGDIGCLPMNSKGDLNRLLNNNGGNYAAWSFNAARQTGAGWNGPYITGSFAGEEPEDFTKDQWGNPYTYTFSPPASNCPLIATIVSNGPDGQPSTSDDITVSIAANETNAAVTGIVRAADGYRFANVPVDMNYADNGTITTVTDTTDANGVYNFNAIPFGRRSVQARPTLGYASNSGITTPGSNDRDLQFVIYNFTTSAVTINNLVATYGGGACYSQVWFNGARVVNTRRCSGQTATFSSSRTIAGSSTVPPPQVAIIDAPSIQLPDIILFPQGSSAFIELRNFNNAVNGVAFTITFSNGSVIKFTAVSGG